MRTATPNTTVNRDSGGDASRHQPGYGVLDTLSVEHSDRIAPVLAGGMS